MGIMGTAWVVFISVAVCATSVHGLFADQIGRYDWRRQFVGNVDQLLFDSDSTANLAFVSTREHVVAALHVQTGEIAWRHVFEEHSGKDAAKIVQTTNALISLSHDGRLLRSWEKRTGLMRWESRLPKQASQITRLDFVPSTGDVLVQVDGQLLLFDAHSGQASAQSPIANTQQGVKWFGLVRTSTGVAILGGEAGHNFGVYQFEIEKAKLTLVPGSMVLAAPWYYRERCISVGSFLICTAEEGRRIIYTDCSHNPPLSKAYDLPEAADSLLAAAGSQRYFGVRTRASKTVTLFAVDTNAETIVPLSSVGQASELSACKAAAGGAQASASGYLAVFDSSSSQVRWYALSTSDNSLQPVADWTLNMNADEQKLPPVKKIYAACSLAGSTVQRHLITAAVDYTLDYYSTNNEKRWSRPESLSAIQSVALLELPLTVDQAEIESEFTTHGDSLLMMFARRVRTQLQQLRRALIKAADQVLSLTGLLETVGTSSQIMTKLGYNVIDGGSSKQQGRDGDAFERDYFNLHKLIVVASATGKLYGLDNRKGGVLWQTYLSDVEPWRTAGDRQQMPLYVQRTTAHYPYPAQCALLVKSKISGKGQVIVFDPMTGAVVERVKLDFELVASVLTPHVNGEQVHALLLTGKNGQAITYPADTQLPSRARLYTMHAPRALRHSKGQPANVLYGQRYVPDQTGRGHMEPIWQTPLPLPADQQIYQIVPKHTNEHTHSQGRVLGDRSVLYKYVNPNLAVVLAMTDPHAATADTGVITLFLVDAVTGQVVYTAKHARASCANNQCHVVHCENWIVYSFWNDKARRMELNVLELYEGTFQTDPLRFSSHTPVVNPPLVLKQAYIFSQGITALGVTNTERGLTNRLLLLGLPFGGLLEVQKALLDPRRPLIPTPEHREEGLIPYIPEVPVAAESIFNYNQTALRVRRIQASPSGLESTSLVLAYGLDMYFTRLTPSGTFDVLNEDFDHWLISAALLALIVASVATKKMAKRRDLNNAWR